MNREIKFRQPLFKQGKFLEFHYWGFLERWVDPEFSENGAVVHGRADIDLDQSPETSMQYTGLLDKAGKEIYEGDILQCWYDGAKNPEKPFVVKYHIDADSSGFNRFVSCAVTIIGNIYENSELMEARV